LHKFPPISGFFPGVNGKYQAFCGVQLSHLSKIETIIAPSTWGLTSGEAAVFCALLAGDTATRTLISSAAGVTEGSVSVLIRRIRSKVSAHGIEIETVAGKGWRLIGRETWRRALAALSN
jgi:biotin operon repressor